MASGFNILCDRLPSEFYGHPVKTDFKTVLRFYKMAGSKGLTDPEKSQITVNMFLGENPPEDLSGFDSWLNGFLLGPQPKKSEGGKKVFDFVQDSGRIMSAFYQVYRMDLRSTDLHWWVFLELLGNLPEDTAFRKVIEIRTKKSDNRSTPQSRASLAKAKADFALEENENDDINSLKNALRM